MLRCSRRHGSPDRAARLADYRGAVLAYRQVATVPCSQGLNDHADRLADRAQLCQRRVLRLHRPEHPQTIGAVIGEC